MSWLSHLISTNVRGLGRTIEKYGTPIAAGGLALTGAGLPLSAAILGATKAGGSLLAGHNINNTLRQGVLGAGEGAAAWGAGKLLGGLSSKFGDLGGAGGVGDSAGAAIPDSAIPAGASAARTITGPAEAMAAPPAGFQVGVVNALKGTGSAIKDNPLVAGQVASGVLGARQQGAELDYQKQKDEEERQRREQSSQLLAPLFQKYLQQGSQQASPWANYTPPAPYRG